ncbi:MAG: IS1380 family transposase [bacterium]|nr:IS1380 family transposase [bacterium]
MKQYVKTLDKNRKEIVIDIDATDDPTYGAQQLSLFNGFYYQTMYNELVINDGDTGQMILPVLRPGNAHSNWWYVGILKRIVRIIRSEFPKIKIIIRADSGFSTPKFYEFAERETLHFVMGIASNNVLKERTRCSENIIKDLFLSDKEKYQHFMVPFEYMAATWDKPQNCYAKVESTGKGMNIRYVISNFENQTGREIYKGFYVMRADRSENKIKEFKNMCFSDRLSCHCFWANFFRLFLSALCYKMFELIKQRIIRTKHKKAVKWQISNIRLYLLKVGATIKETVRRVTIRLSNSFVYPALLNTILRSGERM